MLVEALIIGFSLGMYDVLFLVMMVVMVEEEEGLHEIT